jgi:hypothetical protein
LVVLQWCSDGSWSYVQYITFKMKPCF